MKVVLVTGGFDPLHSGHIEYFKAASKLGDKLIVGLNSDQWLSNKKGKPFMPLEERRAVVENLKMVDEVMTWDDSSGHAGSLIFNLRCILDTKRDTIIFANGGDRTFDNIPEVSMWENTKGVEFKFGVGGETKKNSSSTILNNWDKEYTSRDWGGWSVLKNYPAVKVKELTVMPESSLSMQRHAHRNELWFVAEGTATVGSIDVSSDIFYYTIDTHKSVEIPKREWHQLINDSKTKLLKIVEIQYGDLCEEDDIERK